MQEPREDKSGNWAYRLIDRVVHPLTVFITITFILVVLIHFVYTAFGVGASRGIRSLAGVLLPIIVLTFLYGMKRDLLEKIGLASRLVGFVVFIVIGAGALGLVEAFAYTSAVPIGELVLSSSLAVLVFSRASLEQASVTPHFFGLITGFLVYIVALGFPLEVTDAQTGIFNFLW